MNGRSRPGMTRRDFIKRAALGAAAVTLPQTSYGVPAQIRRRPANILFIHTDQQHFQAMSGQGCRCVATPNMDRLLARGVSFHISYSANPICCPARACWYTGRASSENGMLSNDHRLVQDMPDLGQWFRASGYETVYSGKWHIPGRDPHAGFRVLTANPSGQGEHCDPIVSRSAQGFLSHYNGDKPFFLSIGFLQPHDCCYWGFAHENDIGTLPYPEIERDLPPLPDNFEYNVAEPAALKKHMDGVRKWAASWSKLHWRYYLWSYYRHVEMVDAELGRVLDTLDNSRFASDTLIVFTSDHGDGLGRRKMVSKWTLYDEAARVPLVIVPPGSTDGGRRDNSHVVSGLDIAPTLCDYAGIDAPPRARGRSLRRLVEGRSRNWREFAVSEANITGRMLRTPEYKFVAYKDDPVIQLFDMRRDPWEMHNLAAEPRFADVVDDLRKRLADWESSLEPARV